ncbi:MAG: protein translocase SEC61 complex subunit gamma [Candidatus Pacearchaeota archaeon]|nr:protein translocase SEC61 complex subunit gamma [Candidatus Pacearchaeota archaeon]
MDMNNVGNVQNQNIVSEQKIGYIKRLGSFILQSKRVWQVLRKPSMEEFKVTAKVAALGILAIGAIGFLISDIIKVFFK